jgi:hypothetical protein
MGVSRPFEQAFAAREPGDIYLARGTNEKQAVVSIPLDYLKSLILPTNASVANMGGMIVPYEGGYAALALLSKSDSLGKDVLDKMVTLQNADGSWYQQYYPFKPFSLFEDRKVDSGTALLAWAIADYDARNTTILYKAVWQNAAEFLHTLEWTLTSSASLLKNQIINGTVEDAAFSADVAEAILGLTRGLDAYGQTVLDSGGHSVKDLITRLISGIDGYMWRPADYFYQTEYPLGAQSQTKPGVYVTFKQLVTYTQALVAWTLKNWDDKYGTQGQHTQNISDALDRVIAVNRGRWGGYLEHPMYESTDPPQEYPQYAALMKAAMENVNPTKYARAIDEALKFMRWCTLSNGAVLDCVCQDGRCYVSPNARSSLLISTATCVLAGA